MKLFDGSDYESFKVKMLRLTDIRLVDYKPEQMQRRIKALAQRAGADSFDAYYGILAKSPAELASFVDRITINVSELFRNPDRFNELQNTIVPQVLARLGTWPESGMTVWSAGCSIGAEVYSLAILFDEIKPGAPIQFHATDMDRRILEQAKRATFAGSDMSNVSAQRLSSYFRKTGDGYVVHESLRQTVEFEKHDLLADEFPESKYDLIVCRNVVIYFTETAKHRVFEGLCKALKPNGVLFVGGTERVCDWRNLGLDLVLPYFYRKATGKPNHMRIDHAPTPTVACPNGEFVVRV